jgi:hypothetical protein
MEPTVGETLGSKIIRIFQLTRWILAVQAQIGEPSLVDPSYLLWNFQFLADVLNIEEVLLNSGEFGHFGNQSDAQIWFHLLLEPDPQHSQLEIPIQNQYTDKSSCQIWKNYF